MPTANQVGELAVDGPGALGGSLRNDRRQTLMTIDARSQGRSGVFQPPIGSASSLRDVIVPLETRSPSRQKAFAVPALRNRSSKWEVFAVAAALAVPLVMLFASYIWLRSSAKSFHIPGPLADYLVGCI